jgi:cytoskeletal protein CcmA (bactofilin family)
MLDSRKGKAYSENKVVSIIGPGTTVTGEITSQGTIRIEGMVAGRVQSEDSIVVHEAGKVRAELIAGQVVISGEVQGNVFAHERLEITGTGRVVGDITSPRISIAEGVLFEGKCTMKPPGQIKPPAGAQPGPRPAGGPPAPGGVPGPQKNG